MVKVGVIGLGMMGNTHLDVYSKRSDVQVVAIADLDPDRLSGKVKAGGNVKGQAEGEGIVSKIGKKYAEGMDLINDDELDLIDICLTTPLHRKYAEAALAKGKHVMLEKPMAGTYADAKALAEAAKKAKGAFMVGQCMRFWPGWDWAKDAVTKGTYGKVKAAHFRRVASHPGGPFYSNGDLCGGAALDLHVHDADFVNYLFGLPKSVSSVGYSKVTTAVDHIVTQYHYADIPMVMAEGCWCMTEGFGFHMQYTINFEKATAVWDMDAAETLMLFEPGKPGAPVKLRAGMGYEHELVYLLDCIAKGTKPTIITPDSAADSVKLVEAEVKSVKTGQPVTL
jgi:predicted dehydrogenase